MLMRVLQYLVDNGWMLFAGVTALLAYGAVMAALLRSPLYRQRVGEFSVLAALAWMVLAFIPLPRLEFSARRTPVTESSPPRVVRIHEIPPELIARTSSAVAHAKPPVEPATAPPPLTSRIDYRPWLAGAFFAGALACCGWLVLGNLLLWRTLRRAAPAPDHLHRFLESRFRENRRRPRLLLSDRVSRPLTCGVFRPTILLPTALADGEHASQLRQVLLHELAHVCQRDAWGNALFCLALPLLYAHPFYWWLRRRVSLSRELVADDWAARTDGKDAYVSHLVEFARARLAGQPAAFGAIGILDTPSDFYRRMQMLLQRPNPLATRCSTPARLLFSITWLGAVAIAASLAGLRPATAQEAPRPAPPETKPTRPEDANPDGDRADPRGTTTDDRTLEQKMHDRRAAQLAAEAWDTNRRDTIGALNDLTETQVAMVDSGMLGLVKKREAIESEIARLKAAGVGPENVRMKQLQDALEAQKEKNARYLADWRAMQAKFADAPATARAPAQPDRRASVPQDRAATTVRVTGVQLDIVSLADRLIDATGALKLAKAKLGRMTALKNSNAVSQEEIETAEVNLQTAQSRVELFRSIVQVAVQATKEDLEWSTKKYEGGLEGVDRVNEAKHKLQMLELILKNAG